MAPEESPSVFDVAGTGNNADRPPHVIFDVPFAVLEEVLRNHPLERTGTQPFSGIAEDRRVAPVRKEKVLHGKADFRGLPPAHGFQMVAFRAGTDGENRVSELRIHGIEGADINDVGVALELHGSGSVRKQSRRTRKEPMDFVAGYLLPSLRTCIWRLFPRCPEFFKCSPQTRIDILPPHGEHRDIRLPVICMLCRQHHRAPPERPDNPLLKMPERRDGKILAPIRWWNSFLHRDAGYSDRG